MQQLQTTETGYLASEQRWEKDRIELIKRTYCKGATDDELSLFIGACKKLGLSPEARQIYAIRRGNIMSIEVSIDGYRLAAERTGKYEGQTPVEWCGEDGIWKDVWLSAKPPRAARVGIYKKGCREAVYTTAHWDEYAQKSPIWGKMPRLMIAKCAEALALRKSFPAELSGIYTTDEMPDPEEQHHQQPKPGFDPNNKAHFDVMVQELNKYPSITTEDVNKIMTEMIGKPFSKLEEVLASGHYLNKD